MVRDDLEGAQRYEGRQAARAAGESGLDVNRGPRLSLWSLLLEAALHGKGVALTKTALA